MVKRYQLADLPAVAAELLAAMNTPRVITLNGPMGAGKTTLIHAFCDALGVTDPVGSPTYALINEYASPTGPIYHIDCYRLRSEEEALEAGVEDCLYAGAWCFVEWAEKIPRLLPDQAVQIDISVESQQIRVLSCNFPPL